MESPLALLCARGPVQTARTGALEFSSDFIYFEAAFLFKALAARGAEAFMMTNEKFALGALLAWLFVGQAAAQGQSPPLQSGRAPPAGAPNAISPSMLGFGNREPACLAWSDDCVTCMRSDTGEPVCSNIGISCQPKDIQCKKRKSEAPK
jgi:hypothetical protein